jgi:hypothetical protein
MRKLIFLFALLLPGTVFAAPCGSALAASGVNAGAQYVVYAPQPASCANGNVVLFAHGYIPPGAPAGAWLTQLQLPDGTSLPQLLNAQGFVFAASGFSKDGLAIPEGMQDIKGLVNVIQGLPIPVQKYFVAGASEGGLIAAKLIETDPLFAGGLAVCGPVGDFQKQLNYVGDVRVLFDYFFPGILTSYGGDAAHIPPALILNWAAVETNIRNALQANPFSTLQLVSTGNIPIGLKFSNAVDAVVGVLRYNVFGANDSLVVFQGNPYDNIGRVYRGSFNDAKLNAMVARFAAAPAAAAVLPSYNTTGSLKNPLVTLHTLADPAILYEQELLYGAKVRAAGKSSKLVQLPSLNYGHCNVTANEAKLALLALMLKAGL